MTEEDAERKWCPFTRVEGPYAYGNPAINRHLTRAMHDPGTGEVVAAAEASFPDAAHCVGSACMAWRWFGTHINDPADPKGDLIWSNDTHGTCGLAGPWFPETRGHQ